jgi:hypothetical protein
MAKGAMVKDPKGDSATTRYRLAKLKILSSKLNELSFPALERPGVLRDSPPTRELVEWSLRFYCFSMLSHCREMLRSFLFLTESFGVPAAFVVSRCLFELAAQSYYVHKHVQQYIDADDLDSAWKFLMEINMGSRYMNDYATANKDSDFPAPREIQKMIRAWGEWRKSEMQSTYSYLSEYVHPNMTAFSHYYSITTQDETTMVHFHLPPQDPLAAPMPEVTMSLATVLHFGGKMFNLTSGIDVRKEIASLLRELTDEEEVNK